VSGVKLDLMVSRSSVNQRLKNTLQQLDAIEKQQSRGEITAEDARMKIHEVERQLAELKRVQQEIVEAGIRNMFEISSMIHREKESLADVSSKAGENMERY